MAAAAALVYGRPGPGALAARIGGELRGGLRVSSAALAATAPLLAAGVVLLSKQVGWKRAAPMLRAVGVPIAVWALWGAYTHAVYGEVHFLGSTDVVTDMKKWQFDEFWNHTSTALVYIGRSE